MNSDLFRSIFSSNYAARAPAPQAEGSQRTDLFCAAPECNECIAKERIFSYY